MTCVLCAGECRGHSLGHEDQWIPEPGSAAAKAQDSVSDVERLRALSEAATRGEWRAVEHDGSIWIDADDEGDMPVALMMGGSPHNQDRADAAFILAAVAFARAALAVPINKIGEDARTYADGVEDAARYVEGHGGVIPGATAFIPAVIGDRMPSMSGDGRDRLRPARRREFDDATRSLATAIRHLSTSPDKGVTHVAR